MQRVFLPSVIFFFGFILASVLAEFISTGLESVVPVSGLPLYGIAFSALFSIVFFISMKASGRSISVLWMIEMFVLSSVAMALMSIPFDDATTVLIIVSILSIYVFARQAIFSRYTNSASGTQ